MRSGPGIDAFDAPYWKRREPARFYRYVKRGPVQNASKARDRGTPNTSEQVAAWQDTQMSHLQSDLREASPLTFLEVIGVKSVGWMLSLHQSCGIDPVRTQR